MTTMCIEDLMDYYIRMMLARSEDMDMDINKDDALLFAQMVSAQALDNISGRLNNLYFLLKEQAAKQQENTHDD